jgi:metallo-beta-lactamase family protein
MPEVQIDHHGAVDGVTGSCHQLSLEDDRAVLVDCGLFQGKEASKRGATSEALEIEFDLAPVRALLVTHCHIDHVGRIPYLLAAGFQGPIYCTEPTAVLLPLVMEDAIKVGFTRDKRLVNKFLSVLKERLRPVPYDQWAEVPLGEGTQSTLSIRFQRAGHILGSSYIECDARPAGGAQTRVVFSGDIGAPDSPLIFDPVPPEEADVVVLESTYGDRLHEDRTQRRQRLRDVVLHCLSDRGVVLIPAFSIGRTQELLYELETIIHEGQTDEAAPGVSWQELDIIVDSPLAARFTEVYDQLRAFWDEEAHQVLSQGRHPLSFEQLTTIDSHQEHLGTIAYLKKARRPAIIIAASGMCAGGRIMNYLEAFVDDPTTDVVFVGYQAAGTPGRALQNAASRGGTWESGGNRLPVRAGIHTLGGYSAHGDRETLLDFVRKLRRGPRQVRLVHGDDGAKVALRRYVQEACPQAEVLIP